MNRKKQRILARYATVLVALVGIGIIASILLTDDSPSVENSDTGSRSISRKSNSAKLEAGDLFRLLEIKMQEPLVPPAPKSSVGSEKVKRTVAWPTVSLECIIASDSSKVAVFSSGRNSFTCEQGDSFMNCQVERISSTEVVLKFAGESRSFQIPVSIE